jgi:hypothetical protein
MMKWLWHPVSLHTDGYSVSGSPVPTRGECGRRLRSDWPGEAGGSCQFDGWVAAHQAVVRRCQLRLLAGCGDVAANLMIAPVALTNVGATAPK